MNINENFLNKRKIADKLKRYIYKNTYISYAKCSRLTNLVTNKCYDKAHCMQLSSMQIIYMIIFLNINLNDRSEKKGVIKMRGNTYKVTHIIAAYNPRLPHLVPA